MKEPFIFFNEFKPEGCLYCYAQALLGSWDFGE